jgi:hypothetical protein
MDRENLQIEPSQNDHLIKLKINYPDFFVGENLSTNLAKLDEYLNDEIKNTERGLWANELVFHINNKRKNNSLSDVSSSGGDPSNMGSFSGGLSSADSPKGDFSGSNNKNEKDKSISDLIPGDTFQVNKRKSTESPSYNNSSQVNEPQLKKKKLTPGDYIDELQSDDPPSYDDPD